MKARFVQMENTYGIGSLSINYKNDKILYQSLIYSRNGTFKTSFSRALNNLAKGNIEDIRDRITNTPAAIDIDFIGDDGSIKRNDFDNSFIVFSRELFENEKIEISNYNKELSLLTIDKESKDKLNKLMNDSVEKIKDSIKLKLKSSGLNVDKAINFLTNKNLETLNINDLQKMIEGVKGVKDCDISKVNLKNLFQKPYDAIENNEFKEAASNYVNIFNKRLKEELFDENFNDSNCLTFLDDVTKNGYLSEDKKRGIIILGKEYYKIDDIKKIFINAINNISQDPSVLAANRELIKTMGASAEAKKIQNQFNEDPLLINQLSLGKKSIILIALKQQKIEVEEFERLIKTTKEDYIKIIKEAKDKQSDFENAIEIYKNRFNPIFDVSISNKTESILGESVPILSFKHKRNDSVDMTEQDIRMILSSGEKTALNIISFIVEYEANKKNKPILVLDDLVETFDYANRHAFIEYINDLVKENVSVIILTHNYEFYKTLGSRIPELDKLSAFSKDGKVYIEENSKTNIDIEKIFEINNINQFIYAIPFLREIKIMTKENTDILDNCLHYKRDTKNITIKMIKDCFPTIIFNGNINDEYLPLLYDLADHVNLGNQFDIIPKTILSIACRLKIEEKVINDKIELIDEINSNQLSQLKETYKNQLSAKTLNLIEKVQISTPEFIHCNAFMYEPLIDIDGNYLVDIYKEIKNLDENEIWKS